MADERNPADDPMRGSGQAADGGAAIGLRMIEQAEANAHEAFAAMRRAVAAQDVAEVARIQGDYLREQGQRSIEQARAMGELIAQVGRQAVQPPASEDG